jgi:FAD/FMN-containing dehydrogenase
MINELENEIREVYPEGLTWQKTIPTFHPESEEEAADVFRRAHNCGQKLFISGFSNIIEPVGDKFTDLLVIKADRLNYLREIAPQDFFITVGAGYPLLEINKAIADSNLWFPFSSTLYPGSFGGALASGLSGDDGSHPVPFSRYLLSILAVLPDGSIVKPGANTFKSVSGYDISRLFFNSWGALGMVVEMSLRVLPLSKQEESPRISLYPPDREGFVRQLQEDTPSAEFFRKIKDEFDPDLLLPVV